MLLAEGINPAIIAKETFQAVQIEKQHSSNISKVEDGSKRKSKKTVRISEKEVLI